MRKAIIGVGLVLSLATANSTAAQDTGEIRAAFKEAQEEMRKNGAGCTYMRKKFRRFRKEFPDAHFVFAGRKDRTITGIRGCGFAWNLDRVKAEEQAMKSCRKWEAEYGTDGGTKTCRFLK